MEKFRQKMIAFMVGRYGVDELYYGLFGLWIVLTLLGGIFHSSLLSLLAAATVIWQLFRFLSKNRTKRKAENEVYLRLYRPVKSWFILQRDRFRDRKTARYRKCKHCKAICRLPYKKGKHTAVCPKCRERFDVTIL